MTCTCVEITVVRPGHYIHTYCTCGYLQCVHSLLMYADSCTTVQYMVKFTMLCVCGAFCMLRSHLNFNFHHYREDVNLLSLTLMAVQWFLPMIILHAFMESTHQVGERSWCIHRLPDQRTLSSLLAKEYTLACEILRAHQVYLS